MTTGLRTKFRQKQKGQALVILGMLFGFGVLIGLVALAFDGGSALLQRRHMQNGADAAAFGTAKMLAASVVISSSVPVFMVTNQDVTNTVNQYLTGNRGEVIGPPSYRGTLEYGNFVQATSSYTFTQAATFTGTETTVNWSYVFPNSSLVPSWIDAVRVTSGIENPTTFGQAIGITSVPVSGIAAAALQGVPNHIPGGATWPMTRCAFPSQVPPVTTGICDPFLFWSSNINEPGCRTQGNWNNLIQLGARQGNSYENAQMQLIQQFDTRPPMLSKPEGDQNPCGSGVMWSPAGNCTDPLTYPPYGNQCCDNTNFLKYDAINWLINDFQGRLSITQTRSASFFTKRGYNAPPERNIGDWPEAYVGGVAGQNIQSAIRTYIQNSPNARTDRYSGPPTNFGRYVDKTMYLYKVEDGEKWETGIRNPQICGGAAFVPCDRWMPESSTPNRVHVTQAYRFRFYENLATTNANPPARLPMDVCGTNDTVPVNSGEIKGVFVGEDILEPPPSPGGVGIYNYVGFIDPGSP